MEEKMSGRQGICLLALFILGSTLVTEDIHPTRQDAWIALLMGFVAAIPFLLIYQRIQHIFCGASLYEVAFAVFGKIGGAVISALYTLFFAHLAVMIVSRFIIFAHMTTLAQTPGIWLALVISGLAGWMGAVGAQRFGRASVMMFLLVALELVALHLLSIEKMEPARLLPILEASPWALADEAFSFFSVPFTQTVVFLCMFHGIPDRSERSKIWRIGTVMGVLIVVVNLLRVAMVLGGEIMGTMYYSTFLSSSVIGLDSVLQRVEVILSHAFFLSLFVKVAVYLHASCQGCARLFPKWNIRTTAIVLSVLVATASAIFGNSVTLISELYFAYRIYTIPFQVLLPVIIWIRGEFILRKQRKGAPVA
ncbi:MAG: endospore germination permease [Clostridia bacterium]|nr:endospore germination permease [Clostridia bacterium]